ncbi:helix-turn-helix domain-containing protein [Paenibacillus sp. LMG 31461]|uniref:Helix-turn-helix domain-containing protein n=1 Tax=Paenibacillus plantarum TaxID=2654975 RepID=A0ABX1XF00_9BACL|nr:helix-turn-helix domain-containing protein [Paenibacillus plantarum]NOU67078.1 helix-turn-helix domain-containing protein [Paenibacillus plantarum]
MAGIFNNVLGYIQKYKYNKRFFRKSLVMILIMASIPGLIIGLSIYWIATNNVEKELQGLHQNQISNRAANIDDQLAFLEMTVSHWAFDSKFDEKLKTINFAYNYDTVQDMYRTLLSLESAHPFLQKVELFLDKPRPLVFSTERYTFLSNQSDIENYENLLQHDKSMFWMLRKPQGTGKQGLAIINKIPGDSTEPFGALVATLNQDNLLKVLKTLTPYDEGVTMLFNEKDEWNLSSSGAGGSELDLVLKEAYAKHQMELGEAAVKDAKPESFLFDYNKISYSVSYGHFNRLGQKWVYISAAPLSSITAPVIAISKWILVISVSGLLFALLLSWFVSRRIYHPVQRLMTLLSGEKNDEVKDEFAMIEKHWQHMSRESETMRHKLEEQMPLLREGFFLQLAQGYLISLQENDMKERMKRYGWETEDRQFVALVFQLTGFANLEGRFSQGDESLVTFAASNIIDELIRSQYEQAEIINFHNFSIGVLLSFPLSHPTTWLEDDLEQVCQEIIRAINGILKMQVTISISKWVHNVKQIPHLFEEVKQALVYRDLLDENQIIKTEQLSKLNVYKETGYPFTLDKEIINAIRNGQESGAIDLIAQFMKELAANGSTEFMLQQGMLQLLGSIRYASLQSGMNPVQLFGSVNLFEQLAQIKEPEEMLKWFQHKVIGVFVQEMISRQDYHFKQIIEQVIVHLREQYMTQLSLESCADLFGTSPYTLSRAFKQITGINFIDFLTNIRISNAKSLLIETDMKINEVADAIGYQHSYFNRLFKKYEGITPSQFRELNRTE